MTTRLAGVWRRTTGNLRAWVLVAAIGVGVLLLATRLSLFAPPLFQPPLPWFAMSAAVLIYRVPRLVRPLVGNQAVKFSLLPLFAGPLLLFMSPIQALTGLALGGVVVAVAIPTSPQVVRRVFNVSKDVFGFLVAEIELQALGPLAPAGSARAAGLYLLVEITLMLISWALVLAVVDLYSWSWNVPFWRGGGRLLLIQGLALCGLGGVGMFLVTVQPLVVLLLFVPVVWGIMAQNRLAAQDAERTRLVELHEIGEMLLLGDDLSRSMSEYVRRASRLLSSDFVELIILGRSGLAGGDRPGGLLLSGGFTVRLANGSDLSQSGIGGFSAVQRGFLARMRSLGVAEFGSEAPGEVRALFAAYGLSEGFGVRLGDADGVLGVLIAGNGAYGSRKDRARLALGRNLAIQTTIALERSTLLGQVRESVAERERLLERSLSDSLTGLGNRDRFTARLTAALEDLAHSPGQVALLFIDLDDFKAVNDGMGHRSGDEVLQVVARRLEKTLRPQDVVARLGGDEFGILLTDIAGVEDAVEVANRVVHALASPIAMGRRAVRIGASVGVVCTADPGAGLIELVEAADQAMYRAKRRGKNQVFVGAGAAQSLAVSA
jgi:diguanylate cyclase (GGDEF)-like protein